ncbi:hypothetical protein [Eggerthia catenaformis]|uniref:hypothetical protein n=1 Tax=Eggerthia catenaformis TaxID=31973 RepID=UPI00248E06E3|nr:hypothetical protein [Eggerthia catenaformis]
MKVSVVNGGSIGEIGNICDECGYFFITVLFEDHIRVMIIFLECFYFINKII